MSLNPDAAAMEASFVVFDFETTGLSPERDEIIEIGAVRIQRGKEVDTFSTLINPLRPIPAQATAVHGIDDAMVASAPSLDEMLPKFLAFMGEDVLAGHNVLRFDGPFLSSALRRYKVGDMDNFVMDTLILSQRAQPQHRVHNLEAVAARLNVAQPGAHRALQDASVTGRVLVELLMLLSGQGQRSFMQVAKKHGVPLGRIKGSTGGAPVRAYLETMSGSLFGP